MTDIKEISVEEAYSLLSGNEAVAIDVRELEEFNAGRICDIQFNPLSNFDITKVPHNGIVIVVCRSGQRSGRVCEALLETHPHLRNLKGGMKAWSAAGYSMESDYDAPFVL